MQKALPVTLFFLCLFTILITSSASANDGKGGNNNGSSPAVPGLIHKSFRPTPVDPKTFTERSWLGNIGQSIGDFFSRLFGHHHDHAAPASGSGSPAPGGSAAPGGTPPPGSPSVPFNTGIGVLLVAGIGLGVKMARDRYRTAAINA